jgi:NitT/TauT family transport system permease protein
MGTPDQRAEPQPPPAPAQLWPALQRALVTVGLPLIGTVVAIGAWWLATIVFGIRAITLPSPPQIVEALLRLPEHLLQRSWETLWVTVAGFAIAAVGGTAVALMFTASRLVERAVLPLVVILNAIPKVAVVPLLLFWLGRGHEPKLVLVILICFFPIVVSAMAGFRSTPADLGELSRSLSATGWQTFVKVRFPWALPQMFVGFKVAMPLAMIGAVVAEIASPNSGLGSVIVRSGASLDTPLAFAAITLLAVMSVALFYLVVAVERLLLPWVRETSA